MSNGFTVLNITSWRYITYDATHYYGVLIIINDNSITEDDVIQMNLRHVGERIELFYELSEEEAIELDNNDGTEFHHELWLDGDNKSNRFFELKKLIGVGYDEWKKLSNNTTFLVLYEGDKIDELNKYIPK